MEKRVKTKVLALLMSVMMVFAMVPGMTFAGEQAEAPDAAAPTVSENTDSIETPSNDEVLTDDATDRDQMDSEPVAAPKAKRAKNVKIKVTVNMKGVIAKTRQGGPMAHKTVTVRDLNRDGKLSVHEAYIAAHKAYNRYSKNAKKSGYVSDKDGLIKKLWGQNTDNIMTNVSGHRILNTKDDFVKNGDYLYASINAEPNGNDWYTTFDRISITRLANEEFTLNLSGWHGKLFNPASSPVKNIQIGTWNKGKFTPLEGKKTDGNGNVTLMFPKAGKYYVTAQGTVSGSEWGYGNVEFPTMAPMCVVTAKAAPNAKITMTVNNKGVIAKAKKGKPMAMQPVTVKDLDKDGRLTVLEAYIAAHKRYNRYSKNIKRSGYSAYYSEEVFRTVFLKFWGQKIDDNNFRSFRNNKLVIFEEDETVENGDFVYASIRTNQHDYYTYFDKSDVKVKSNQEFTLRLLGFKPGDALWGKNPVPRIQVGTWSKGKFKPIKDAVTDEHGYVTLNFKKRGTYYVTAKGIVFYPNGVGGYIICYTMAPACKVKVTK